MELHHLLGDVERHRPPLGASDDEVRDVRALLPDRAEHGERLSRARLAHEPAGPADQLTQVHLLTTAQQSQVALGLRPRKAEVVQPVAVVVRPALLQRPEVRVDEVRVCGEVVVDVLVALHRIALPAQHHQVPGGAGAEAGADHRQGRLDHRPRPPQAGDAGLDGDHGGMREHGAPRLVVGPGIEVQPERGLAVVETLDEPTDVLWLVVGEQEVVLPHARPRLGPGTVTAVP